MEVVQAIVKARMVELERERVSKAAERGGNDKRILLQELGEAC